MTDKLKPVIVRGTASGNHFGYLVGHDGPTVRLVRSRRMWKWWAAKDGSLSGCAVYGIKPKDSKIGPEVAAITILDACEIIDCTAEAAESIMGASW